MNAPPLRDPVGLVERSPELADLAAHSPALRKAIESGRPLDAYRALFWASKLGRFKGDLRDTARALLVHRRVFFKPLRGAPTMMTYNGIGTSLYGRADFDGNDATYVATLFLVVIFVPVFPIASYLVRDAQNNGRRAWTFMAKVPLGAMTYLWQRAIALGVLAMVAVGVARGFEGYGHGTVYVVNGLERGVEIALSGAPKMTIPPGGKTSIRTAVGKHAIAVRDGDRELESGSLDVPRGQQAIVWNVLGAAPVYVATVVYSEGGSANPPAEAKPDVLCGESLMVRDGIDYVFEDPPKSLSTSKTSGTISKSHLTIAPGGLATCTEYLASHGDVAKAAHLALHVAQASRTPAKALSPDVEGLVVMAPGDEGERFAKDLLARDDSVEAHRIYQNLLLARNQRDRAIAEYDARLAARPNDGDAEYLALRVRTQDDERPRIDGAVARFPDHAYLRRAQLYTHHLDRDFAGVIGAGDALRKLDHDLWLQSMADHVEALVALGRGSDAMALAQEEGKDARDKEGERRGAQFLAFRVAHRIGAPLPEIDRDPDESDAAPLFQRLIAGIDVSTSEIDALHDDEMKLSLRIVRAARARPDSALSLVRTAGARTMREIPMAVRALLLGEAARRDETRGLVDAIAAGTMGKSTLDAIVAFVREGKPSDDVAELPLEMQSAIDFTRSRAGGIAPKEKSDRLSRARSGDVWRGPVTIAIEGWPT